MSSKPCTPWVVRSAKADKVAPCACSASTSVAHSAELMPSCCNQGKLPSNRRRPSTVACTPLPGTAAISVGVISSKPCALAAATTARASGCSLPLCTLAAQRRAVIASWPGAGTCCVRCGCPSVSVPVLSNVTVCTRCAISSAWTSLIKIPCLAATPVPAMMATGVAKPKAQGHAITKTATAWMSAVSKPSPSAIQVPKVSKAINRTTGTKTSATLSTKR